MKKKELKSVFHIGMVGPIELPSLKPIFDNYDENWPKGMGGVPVNHLIIALINRGFKVSVFSFSPEIPDGKSFEYHQDNLSIYLGPARKRFRKQLADSYKVERNYIKACILKTKPEIIHAHWQYEWALAALDTKIPTLVTCHDSPAHTLKLHPTFFRLFRMLVAIKVLRKARFISAVSPYCAKGINYLTSTKVHVIANFEPDFVFKLYTTRSIDASGPIKIAMINNRFSKIKNVQVGIKAFNIFKKRYSTAELHLFGMAHGIGEEAQTWCIKNNICTQNIFFRGFLLFEKLMHELATMSIFLHTSLEESFGMVIAEAMAMGIPTIAGNNSGGTLWLLQNGGGIQTNVTDEIQVAEALTQLSDNSIYQKHSKIANQEAKKRFSEQTVVNQYYELYQRILNSDNYQFKKK